MTRLLPSNAQIADVLEDYIEDNPIEADISLAYPIGAFFITDSTDDPTSLLGFGEWERVAGGRALVGLIPEDDDYGTAGAELGDATVTLTAAQSGLPQHTHEQNSHNHTQDAHNHTQDAHNHTQYSHVHEQMERSSTSGSVNTPGSNDTSSTAGTTGANTGATVALNQQAVATNQATVATNQAATASNQNAGPTNAAEAHNNIPPSFVVNIWKRTA